MLEMTQFYKSATWILFIFLKGFCQWPPSRCQGSGSGIPRLLLLQFSVVCAALMRLCKFVVLPQYVVVHITCKQNLSSSFVYSCEIAPHSTLLSLRHHRLRPGEEEAGQSAPEWSDRSAVCILGPGEEIY